MAFTRSKKEKLKSGMRRSEWRDEADSTVACWAAPLPKRRRNADPLERIKGVDWQNGLPEGPLLRIFETLLAQGTDEAKLAMHNAAATCTLWHESFLEVFLGDTAASRPERPALPRDDTQEKKALATTATTCAAVCEPSKSETNGFEASSARRQQAAVAAPAAAAFGDRGELQRSRSQQTVGEVEPEITAAGAAGIAPAELALSRGQQRRRKRVARPGQHYQQQQLPPLPLLLTRTETGAAGPAAAAQHAAGAAAGPSVCAGTAWRLPGTARTGSMLVPSLEAGAAVAAAAGPRRQNGLGGLAGARAAAAAQQQNQDEEVLQPSAARAPPKRTRRLNAPAAAAAARASDVTAQPGGATDGDGQQEEVMQPTTAQNIGIAAEPAAGRCRGSLRMRNSSNAAAAVAANPTHAHNAADDQQHEELGQLQQAPHRQSRRRRLQSQQQQQQVMPAQAPRQQQPTDSTEAQQVGGLSGGRAAGPASRQGSGSNRQEGWLGNVAHTAHNLAQAINPLHWFRGGSS